MPESFGLGAGRAAAPDAAEEVRRLAPGFVPRVGLLLGSGMGAVAESIEEVAAVRLDALPGMPASSVEGHAGRLVLGRLAGVAVACLQGRVHLYEGVPAREAVLPVRLLAELGCRVLVSTSAVGAIRADLAPGDLVLVEDHINLTGANPLAGPPGEGPRFLDQSEAWAPHLKAALRRAASGQGMALPSGVYLATLGPTFETPAEVRAFRALGADLVGMSLVPEAIAARHAGLAVAGLAIVVNKAAGLQKSPLTHEETLAHAGRAAGSLARLLAAALPEIAHG
ncbi:purine-nucleoside phosphorylase [Geminicoccaceae bacterium 1502E]|nr:purine-nucleoside phosphorylase [Geminicoccaceae bacterium 1502E]